MNVRVILRDTGTVLKYSSIVFLIPIFVALMYGEYFTIYYFLLSSLPFFSLGIAMEKLFFTEEKTLLKEGLVIVSLMWVVISLISTIPYLGLTKLNMLESTFETMSAWTTTGFSILVPEEIPKTMLFFRSIQQWFGGVGIIVLALAGMFRTGASLYYAEARTEKIRPNILNTAKMIWWIYAFYTLAGTALLIAAGMAPFDAANHSMTAIATGGLSTHSASIGFYNSVYVELAVVWIMIIGCISFLSHADLAAGKFGKFFSDVFIRSLFAVILLGTAAVFGERGLRIGFFTVVSAISSSGFNLDAIDAWPAFSLFAIILLMLVGGCAGATASGIKINRLVVAVKSVMWSVYHIRRPMQVFQRRIGDIVYPETLVSEVLKFILLYIAFTALGAFVFLYEGYTLTQSVFQSVSAIGNNGLSVITEYTPVALAMHIFLMWVGRLEIWAVLVLFSYFLVRSKDMR